MKAKTKKHLKDIIRLLKWRECYFWIEPGECGLRYVYPPKNGWSVDTAEIDSVPLRYVPDHDWEILEMRKEESL